MESSDDNESYAYSDDEEEDYVMPDDDEEEPTSMDYETSNPNAAPGTCVTMHCVCWNAARDVAAPPWGTDVQCV